MIRMLLMLAILLVLLSCGKLKVDVKSPNISVSPVEVNHNIGFNTAVFRDDCKEEYKDVEDEEAKKQLVDECVENYKQNLLDLINGINQNKE